MANMFPAVMRMLGLLLTGAPLLHYAGATGKAAHAFLPAARTRPLPAGLVRPGMYASLEDLENARNPADSVEPAESSKLQVDGVRRGSAGAAAAGLRGSGGASATGQRGPAPVASAGKRGSGGASATGQRGPAPVSSAGKRVSGGTSAAGQRGCSSAVGQRDLATTSAAGQRGSSAAFAAGQPSAAGQRGSTAASAAGQPSAARPERGGGLAVGFSRDNDLPQVLEGTVSVLGWLLGDMVRRMAMGGDAAAEFDAERRYEAGRADGLMGVFYSDRSARPAGAVLNVPEYIKQLHARVRCSREALFLAFLYLDRVCGTWARWHAGDRRTKQWHVGPDNVQRLLLASVYAASVYLEDDHERVSFGSWAYAGKLPKEEIPTLARNFLVLLDWRLYVAPEEYLGALQQFQPVPHYLRIRHDLPATRNRMQAGPGHWEAHPNPG